MPAQSPCQRRRASARSPPRAARSAKPVNDERIARLSYPARVARALARYLAQPVSRPAASGDVLALSALLRPGDVLLTEGNTRAAALVRRVTRSPWAHVSIYVGPLEAGDDPRCIVEAEISAGVRAVPLSEFKGQRARIVRPLGLNETDRQRLADWLVGHIGDPYDLAHAWALGRWFLKLPAPRTMVQDAKRFICSSLLVQAFLFVGHPIVTSQARYVVPRDFESAAGFRGGEGAAGLSGAVRLTPLGTA